MEERQKNPYLDDAEINYALMFFTRGCPRSVVDQLLEKGADPNGEEHHGLSLLSKAIHTHYPRASIELLLALGADPKTAGPHRVIRCTWQ